LLVPPALSVMDLLTLGLMAAGIGLAYLHGRNTARQHFHEEERRDVPDSGDRSEAWTSHPQPEEVERMWKVADLKEAITRLSFPEIQQLVKSGIDLEHQYEDGKTALHLACESGSPEICEFLLNCGANPAIKDQAGRTPLLCAVEAGRVNILRILIRKGIDTSVRDHKGRTGILIAAERGDVWILLELYASRKYVPMEHARAIDRARRSNKPEVVNFLENVGVHLETTKKSLETNALEVVSGSMHAVCQNLYSIISHQISQPDSLSRYVNLVIDASKIALEGPHDMPPELNYIFATLYRAIFDDHAKNNKSSADAHLTAVKVIAKSLGYATGPMISLSSRADSEQ
jgi:ankyrin repeat protein